MNISITTHVYGHGEGNAPTVIIRSENRFFDGSSALVSCDALALELRMSVGSPHHCRELAQQLQGAADALVDHATACERRAARANGYVPVNGEPLAVGDAAPGTIRGANGWSMTPDPENGPSLPPKGEGSFRVGGAQG